MKTVTHVVTLLLAVVFLWRSAALAEVDILPGKIGNYGRYYNVDTEESFTARVVKVHEVGHTRFSKACLALEVLPSGEESTAMVYLGPKGRVEKTGFSIQEGADVCVVASRVSVEGKPVLISKSVMDGYEELVLRSDDGRHFNLDLRRDYARDGAACTIAAVRTK
ncbi:MAG: hypothetical protein P1P84_03475 [Deferrisomatales bacterium]|nr:hypothetical protein [Deferrisomatales bacterium]